MPEQMPTATEASELTDGAERVKSTVSSQSGPILYGVLLGAGSAIALLAGALLGNTSDSFALLTPDKTQQATVAAAPAAPYAYIELPTGVYQIAGPDRENYLSAKVVLRVAYDDEAIVKNMLPEIEDTIGGYIRLLEPEDVRGPMGLYELRQAILHRVHYVMGNSSVDRVLITDLLVG